MCNIKVVTVVTGCSVKQLILFMLNFLLFSFFSFDSTDPRLSFVYCTVALKYDVNVANHYTSTTYWYSSNLPCWWKKKRAFSCVLWCGRHQTELVGLGPVAKTTSMVTSVIGKIRFSTSGCVIWWLAGICWAVWNHLKADVLPTKFGYSKAWQIGPRWWHLSQNLTMSQ